MKKAKVVATEFCEKYGYVDGRLHRQIKEAVDQAREEMRMRCLQIVDDARAQTFHEAQEEICDRIAASFKTPEIVYKYDKEGS